MLHHSSFNSYVVFQEYSNSATPVDDRYGGGGYGGVGGSYNDKLCSTITAQQLIAGRLTLDYYTRLATELEGIRSIVANRPGMAETVPECWALSRWCLGCPGIYTQLALRLPLA